MPFDSPSPERALSGAVRSPARRSHNSRPYTRPGLNIANGLSTPTGKTLRRSGSEGGLFGGLKSLFSRPLQWLATPTRSPPPAGVKRDMEHDPEDPPSPSLRATKRVRRLSPAKNSGPYAPSEAGGALPSLPAHVSLSRRANRNSLPASASMPYLDPPRSLLAPSSPRTTLARRPIGRSRMDLASLADEAESPDLSRRRTLAPSSGDTWSPWKAESTTSSTPRRSMVTAFPSTSPFTAPARGLSRSHTLSGLSGIAREPSVTSDASMRGLGSRPGSRLRASASMHFDDDDRMSGISERSERSERASARELFNRRGSIAQQSRLPALPQPAVQHSPAPIRKGQMVWDGERGFVRESEVSVAPMPVAHNDAERILQALEAQRKPAQPITSSSGLPSSLVGASSRAIRKAIAVPIATTERKRSGKEWLQNSASAAISPYGRRRVVDEASREERRQRREARRAESESEMEVDSARSASVASSTRSRRSRSRQSDDMSVSDRTPSPPRRSTRSRKRLSPVEETPKPVRRSTRLRKDKEQESTTPAKSPRATKKNLKSPEPTPRRRRKQTTPPPEREASPPPAPVITTTAPSPSTSKDSYHVRDDSEPRQRSSLRAGAERKHRAHQGAASYNSSRATSPSGGGRFSARDEDLPAMEDLEAVNTPVSFKGFSMPLFSQEKKESTTSDGEPSLSSRITVAAPSPAPQTGGSLSVPAGAIGRTPLTRLGSGLSTRPRASSPLAASSITAEPDSPRSKEKEAEKEKAPLEPPAEGFFSLSGASGSASSSATLTPGSTTPAGKPPASNFFAPPAKSDSTLGLGKPSTPAPAPAPAAEGTVPNFFASSTPPLVSTPPPALDFGIKPQEITKPAPFSFGDKPAEKPAAPFDFGKASLAPETKGDAPKTPFNFGTPSSTPPPAAEKPADPKPAFSFGAPSKPADKPAEPKPLFNFGSTPAPAGNEAPKADAPKAPFNFGAPSTSATPAADKIDPKPLNFGSSAPVADKPVQATPFSFGAPAKAAEKPADKPFSFGAPSAPATNGTANSDKPAFSFGSTSASTSAPASGGFNFGKSDSKSASPSLAPAETPGLGSGSGGFSFGGPAKEAEKPKAAFSFGASSAPAPTPPATSTSTFNFGSTSTPPATAAPSSGGFGSGGTGFGASSSTPSTGFGSSSSTAAAPSAGFSFGAAKPASTGFGASTGTGFGSSSTGTGFGSTSTPPSGGFGSGSTPAAPATGFGSSNTSTTPAFGSSPAPSPGFGASTNSGFSFGAPSSTPAATGFGAGSSASSTGFGAAAPANGFGAPAASTGFGSSSTPSAPAAAPFSFGASGSSTPTASPASFSFGASSAAAPAPASSGFSFGAPSSSAAPAAPFQFGAPAPSSGFGSPTPAPATPTAEGGFSLGMGAAPPSPGGRKIKPLRRGAIKR